MKRYDLVTNYRCGSSIEEMEHADDGEWMRFEDHAAIVAGYEQRLALIHWWSEPARAVGAVDPHADSTGTPSTRESQSSSPALAALLDPAPQLLENKEDHTRVGPSVPCVAPVGSTAEQGQGEQSSPAPDIDVQLLAWAVGNCHTLARRRLRALGQRVPLDALLEKERESWEHVLRICEKAGARSAGVLRASVPTELTEG